MHGQELCIHGPWIMGFKSNQLHDRRSWTTPAGSCDLYIHTPVTEVMERGGIPPSLFADLASQQTLGQCYADPRIWKGINVLVHETQMNRWASTKALIRRIQGEVLLRSELKQWNNLWEDRTQCNCCVSHITSRQPVFRCFRCANSVHYTCLMENSLSQNIPSRGHAESQPIMLPLLSNQAEENIEMPRMPSAEVQEAGAPEEGSPDIELRDPHLNPLKEIVLDTGTIHALSIVMIIWLETLLMNFAKELWVRDIAILVRSMACLWGSKPRCWVLISEPHPFALIGGRFMLLFVWRLDTVRLLWAFAVAGKTKECVRSCLNDVVAELNSYTGVSKPPVLRPVGCILIRHASFFPNQIWSG